MERVSGFIVIEEESDQLITTYLTTLDKQSSCKKTTQNPILNKEGLLLLNVNKWWNLHAYKHLHNW